MTGPIPLTTSEWQALQDALPHPVTATEWRRFLDVVKRIKGNAAAELEQLSRWKAEAMPVLAGLQEVGRALGLRPGEQITGRTAVDAALDLRNERDAARAGLAAVEAMVGERSEFDEVEERWVRADDVRAALRGER